MALANSSAFSPKLGKAGQIPSSRSRARRRWQSSTAMGQRIPWIALFSAGSPSSEREKGSMLSCLEKGKAPGVNWDPAWNSSRFSQRAWMGMAVPGLGNAPGFSFSQPRNQVTHLEFLGHRSRDFLSRGIAGCSRHCRAGIPPQGGVAGCPFPSSRGSRDAVRDVPTAATPGGASVAMETAVAEQ